MAENEKDIDPATGAPRDYRKMFAVLEGILIDYRDTAVHQAETHPVLKRELNSEVSAYQLAIGAMHITTRGAFGQSYNDQLARRASDEG